MDRWCWDCGMASSGRWQLTLGICLGSTRVPMSNFSVGLELCTVWWLRRLASPEAGSRDARLVRSCAWMQHGVVSTVFSESSESPPGLKGVEILTLSGDWRLSGSRCRTLGVGEIVAAIFGKCSLPRFSSHFFSFPCLLLFQKSECFGNDSLYGTMVQQ